MFDDQNTSPKPELYTIKLIKIISPSKLGLLKCENYFYSKIN